MRRKPYSVILLDEVVLFSMLNKEQIGQIVKIQLEDLRGRLKEQDLEREVSESAVALLAERGYEPVYGARPVKRAASAGDSAGSQDRGGRIPARRNGQRHGRCRRDPLRVRWKKCASVRVLKCASL